MTAAKLQYREKLENKSGNVVEMLLKCAQVAQVFSLIDVFLANAQQLLHFIANNLSVSNMIHCMWVTKLGEKKSAYAKETANYLSGSVKNLQPAHDKRGFFLAKSNF